MLSKNIKKKQNKYFIVKEFVNIDKKGLIYEIEEGEEISLEDYKNGKIKL